MVDPAQATQAKPADSLFENEIGAYRAVSAWAVASLILGLLGVLCFVNRSFLAFALAAVLLGALALRNIARYPNLLTGRRLANLGIGIGLVCGLSSVTLNFVQGKVIEREVRRFAATYCETLNNGNFAEIFFLQVPEPERRETTAAKFLEEIRGETTQQFDSDPRTVVIKDLVTRLGRSDQEKAHFLRIEGHGYEGIKPVAWAIIELDGPEAAKEPNLRHAMLVIHATKSGGRRSWYVHEVRYPYESGSLAKTVESAHGHDH